MILEDAHDNGDLVRARVAAKGRHARRPERMDCCQERQGDDVPLECRRTRTFGSRKPYGFHLRLVVMSLTDGVTYMRKACQRRPKGGIWTVRDELLPARRWR